MFLPEHREQLLAHRRRVREFRMPELDEEWLAEMSRMLVHSLQHVAPITVIYGSTYHAQQFTGIVKQIDPYDKWVRLTDRGEQQVQIAFRQIIEIREA